MVGTQKIDIYLLAGGMEDRRVGVWIGQIASGTVGYLMLIPLSDGRCNLNSSLVYQGKSLHKGKTFEALEIPPNRKNFILKPKCVSTAWVGFGNKGKDQLSPVGLPS